VVYQRGLGTISEVLQAVQRDGSAVVGVSVEDEGDRAQAGLRRAVVRTRTNDEPTLERAIDGLADLPEVRSARVQFADAAAHRGTMMATRAPDVRAEPGGR